VLLLFCITPKHTDVSQPYWHWFKNSIMTEIRPFYSQPFTNNHFHFPLSYNPWPAVLLLQSELHYRFLCLSSDMMQIPHRHSKIFFPSWKGGNTPQVYQWPFSGPGSTPTHEAKPSQSSNWGTETCASLKSTSPCLLAIPAFDRKAGLSNRHLNSNSGICLR